MDPVFLRDVCRQVDLLAGVPDLHRGSISLDGVGHGFLLDVDAEATSPVAKLEVQSREVLRQMRIEEQLLTAMAQTAEAGDQRRPGSGQ